jgi:hypothetical protein
LVAARQRGSLRTGGSEKRDCRSCIEAGLSSKLSQYICSPLPASLECTPLKSDRLPEWRFHLFNSGSTCTVEAAPRVVTVQVRPIGASLASAYKLNPFFRPNGAFGLSRSTLPGEAAGIASRAERARLAQLLSLQVGARFHFTIHTAQPSQGLEAFVDESSGHARFTCCDARKVNPTQDSKLFKAALSRRHI